MQVSCAISEGQVMNREEHMDLGAKLSGRRHLTTHEKSRVVCSGMLDVGTRAFADREVSNHNESQKG